MIRTRKEADRMKSSIVLAVLSIIALSIFADRAYAQKITGRESQKPYAGIEDKMLFGQFVGDWNCEVWDVNRDGSKQAPNKCEWHWGWILDGRAVQDVWIVHPDDNKSDAHLIEHGTTIRVYDPKIDEWHCVWIGPVKNNFVAFIAKQIGKEIVLETANDHGRVGQWIFSV